MPRFSGRRSRFSRRRPARRTTRGRRVIRRRPITRRRRTMTRRSVLNAASNKYQDNRLTFSNVDSPLAIPTQKNVVMTGGQTYMIPYIPTAMDRTSDSGAVNIPGYRTKDEVFMRGYRERVTFVTSSAHQWDLRRICFKLRGNAIISNVSGTSPLWYEATPNGWTRTATQALGTALGTSILNELFKGAFNIDWNDYFSAPIDTNRVTIAYDKQFHFRSGNEEAHSRNFKLWHPMNANFYYRDDENGSVQQSSTIHSSGKRGMGDYYIVDFWRCVTGSAEDAISVNYEGTLFWHER